MNSIYKIYFLLPDFARFGYAGKAVNRLLELLLVHTFKLIMPGYLQKSASQAGFGLNQDAERKEKYIISVTSFPARIEKIWITLDCLLRQTFKPDKVILWLANEQFPDKKLPDSLLRLQERGLEIKFCEDLKSHKKFYYTMLENPDANVITFDDDVYYPNYILEKLVETHKKFPEAVVANFAHKVVINNGKIANYMKWKHKFKAIKEPSHWLLQVGVGGVLYPSGKLYKDAFDKNLIFAVSPRSDDVWLKTQCYLNDTKIVTNNYFNKQLITVRGTQKESLVSVNSHEGLKDIQIRQVMDHYKIDFSNC